MKKEVKELCPHDFDMREVISYCLYPKVTKDYWEHEKEYGYLMRMGSHVFFNGLAVGETNLISIEDGKTLVIRYVRMGDANEDGTRNVIFELNGNRRIVSVPDPTIHVEGNETPMADPQDKSQSGASIPGLITKINYKVGDSVKENDTLGTIEAMKMETAIIAHMDGVIKEIHAQEGDTVKAGQLIFTLDIE